MLHNTSIVCVLKTVYPTTLQALAYYKGILFVPFWKFPLYKLPTYLYILKSVTQIIIFLVASLITDGYCIITCLFEDWL